MEYIDINAVKQAWEELLINSYKAFNYINNFIYVSQFYLIQLEQSYLVWNDVVALNTTTPERLIHGSD